MGRYTEAKCRICRRIGEKLFLRGDKCLTEKCPAKRRAFAPGQHGQTPPRFSEYGKRLKEKQKARNVYGLSETQFKNYFVKASNMKGIAGENLLRLLETRLDNVVYRLGLSSSRQHGRQLVRHGHVAVNGEKVNIPSYCLKVGDVLTIRPRFQNQAKLALEAAREKEASEWLSFDASKLEGKVERLPLRSDVDNLIQESLIVEFYSR